MKLTNVDLYRYTLAFTEPVALKNATLANREGVLIRLTTEDDFVGWGETAPLPRFSPETLENTTAQLRELAASVVDQKAFVNMLDSTDLFPSVHFGLELAAWNLSADTSTELLPKPLNGPSREAVLLNGLLSGSSADALEEADRMRAAGYRAVKLKVGGREVGEDVRLVRGVGEVLGDGVSLRLDANRAWGFGEALEFGRGLAGVRIEYVEEPLAEPGRLGELARLWGLDVALDESLVGMEPESLGERRYARAVVLKPTLLGGISRTLRFADEAKALGMRAAISSSYESGVGTGALIALASTIGEEPVGLDTYRRLSEDVIEVHLELSSPTVDVRRATEAARRVDVRKIEPISG